MSTLPLAPPRCNHYDGTMAEAKTVRLDSAQADWLAAEALRAKVSMNRIIAELIDQARADKWQFGKPRYILEAHIERQVPG